jgi:hypothetical protein
MEPVWRFPGIDVLAQPVRGVVAQIEKANPLCIVARERLENYCLIASGIVSKLRLEILHGKQELRFFKSGKRNFRQAMADQIRRGKSEA